MRSRSGATSSRSTTVGRRVDGHGARHGRGNGCRCRHVHPGARLRAGRHLRVLLRRDDRPSARARASRPGPQARAHRHRPEGWQGYGQGHADDVLRHRPRHADPADPKEFLFFNRNATGKQAAKAFIRRLEERTPDRDRDVSIRAFRTQLKAIRAYGRSTPADLLRITQPTLIANGDHDRMVPSVLSRTRRGSSTPTPGTAAFSSTTTSSYPPRSASSGLPEPEAVLSFTRRPVPPERYGVDGRSCHADTARDPRHVERPTIGRVGRLRPSHRRPRGPSQAPTVSVLASVGGSGALGSVTRASM